MDLAKIFTKKNLEILDILTRESLHMREIAEKLGCSPAKVHNSIELFKEYNLVKEKKEKNRKVIQLNKDSALAKEIETIINFDKGKETTDEKMKLFDNISPMDFRYYGRSSSLFEKLQPYLSEAAFIKYMLKVEEALTKTLAKKGLCNKSAADEVSKAVKQVSAEEVYMEEDRIKHNVRALANSIRKRVSEKAKPYVHFTTTSHDIICSADAVRFKETTEKVVVPELKIFLKTLIELSKREKNRIQIGRTHGQHAEPITFGFALAQYVERLGNRIIAIEKTGKNLRGKIAGAVGAYNASSLFFSKPEEFERDVLSELGILASPISTQVVSPEYMADYVHSIVSCFGVLANLADDMRHLQRSEIAEVGEAFAKAQVGSSTMPQKRNPINFENVKAMWKVFMPRMSTVYMDQISEHQRDLTNSASQRFVPEIVAGLMASVSRLNRVMGNLVVDHKNMKKNFDMNKDMIAAEPIYIILAAHNHPDAHEAVRELTLKAQKTKKSLIELVKKDASLRPYLKKFSKRQLEVIKNPENYIGIAVKKTDTVCRFWEEKLSL